MLLQKVKQKRDHQIQHKDFDCRQFQRLSGFEIFGSHIWWTPAAHWKWYSWIFILNSAKANGRFVNWQIGLEYLPSWAILCMVNPAIIFCTFYLTKRYSKVKTVRKHFKMFNDIFSAHTSCHAYDEIRTRVTLCMLANSNAENPITFYSMFSEGR